MRLRCGHWRVVGVLQIAGMAGRDGRDGNHGMGRHERGWERERRDLLRVWERWTVLLLAGNRRRV